MERVNKIDDINDITSGKKYIYDRGNGWKTAVIHYHDGMEIWDTSPAFGKGWKCGFRLINGKESY